MLFLYAHARKTVSGKLNSDAAMPVQQSFSAGNPSAEQGSHGRRAGGGEEGPSQVCAAAAAAAAAALDFAVAQCRSPAPPETQLAPPCTHMAKREVCLRRAALAFRQR